MAKQLVTPVPLERVVEEEDDHRDSFAVASSPPVDCACVYWLICHMSFPWPGLELEVGLGKMA